MASTTKTALKPAPRRNRPAKAEPCAARAVSRLNKLVKDHPYYANGQMGVETLSSLLADIRHACDAMGIDFAERDRQGYGIYISEVKTGGRATRVES